MKRWIALFYLPLISCAQKQYTAAECAALAAPQAYFDRCMGGKINGDYIGDLKCWPFSKSQQVDGILVVSFEQSAFYRNASSLDQIKNAKPETWFENESDEPLPAALQGKADDLTHTYLVKARGRLSLCDAWFGHGGHYPREFISSHFVSARRLAVG